MATRKQLVAQALNLGGGIREAAAELFGFSRSTRLRDTFPQSGNAILTPSIASPVVQLVHPFAGELANYEPVRRFTITGALGADFVNGSYIPAGQCFVMFGGILFHSDLVANHHMSFQLEDNAPAAVDIQSTRSAPTGGLVVAATGVPGNVEWCLRPVIVPPGWRLRGKAFGLGGADTVSFQGLGTVVPISEVAPALWPF